MEHQTPRQKLTFHLQFNPVLPVSARLTQDKTDYCTRCTPAAITRASAISAAWMASPSCSNKHSTFKGRIDREHPNEQTNRRQGIKIRRRERWDRHSFSKVGKDVRKGGRGGSVEWRGKRWYRAVCSPW